MLVIDEKLDKNDFVLILTTKAVSKNLFYQAKASNYPFLALDSTHMILSCRFKVSTFATTTFSPQIADIYSVIHSNEDAETCSVAISKLKTYLKKHLKFEWEVQVNHYYKYNINNIY